MELRKLTDPEKKEYPNSSYVMEFYPGRNQYFTTDAIKELQVSIKELLPSPPSNDTGAKEIKEALFSLNVIKSGFKKGSLEINGYNRHNETLHLHGAIKALEAYAQSSTNKNKMHPFDIIEQIDEILIGYEDWMKGKDGDNCTKARGLLIKLSQSPIK